ncbi:MAG TPA: S26 family signal peptidase [Thermoplasmata archaeon]|nr:S26 family signal peptidase [Thermoplasmata archaeon]
MGSKERERRRRAGSREMKKDRKTKGIVKSAKQFLLDLAFAGVIVLAIMGGLFAYSGVWPPLVVVESGSMQHDERSGVRSSIGVIDTGDLVVVKRAATQDEIVTYVRGRGTNGHATYGEYGDVIVYRKNGGGATPVIHRAFLRVQWNDQTKGWDVPELQDLEYGRDWTRIGGTQGFTDFKKADPVAGHQAVINYVGYSGRNISIDFSWLESGTTGYITLGDNAETNKRPDQALGSGISDGKPVKFEWVVGVARGEIPCFGLIKLFVGNSFDKSNYEKSPGGQKWCALGMIVTIIAVPLVYDIAKEQIRRRKVERGELGEDEEMEGPVKKLVKFVKRKLLKKSGEGTRRKRRRPGSKVISDENEV